MSPKKRLFILSFVVSFILIVGAISAVFICKDYEVLTLSTLILIASVIVFVGVLFFISGIIEYRFYCLRNRANLESSEGAVKQICNHMEMLSFKASSLKSSNEDVLKKVDSIMEIVKSIKPLNDITAAKFEQDIFCKITEVSSMCDGVIAGNDSSDLKKQLSSLEILLKQRAAMKK